MVGGVPGGVVGGVRRAARATARARLRPGPQIIRQTKPLYPQEAFVKKIEGVVEVEFLIDAQGEVVQRAG